MFVDSPSTDSILALHHIFITPALDSLMRLCVLDALIKQALRYPFSTPDCQRYRRYNQLFSIHQLVKSSKHLSISHVTVTRAITCIPTCVTEQGNFSRLQFITKTLLCDGSLTSLLRLCSHGCDRRFRLILCIVPSSFKDRTKRSRFDR
ncbi:uncharacterized [Tachysurus ichikawai]